MSFVWILNRVSSSKSTRIKLENVDLGEDVSKLRKRTIEQLEVEENAFELLYAGQVMTDGESLSSYNINSGVTVHTVKKVSPLPVQNAEPMDAMAVQQVVTALQSALINPAYRNTVEKMLSNPETLENLITATPGLENDLVALAMLQDPELLAMLADPKLIHSVIKAHPSLGHAASFVAAAVSEEAAKGGGSSGARASARGHYYSMDQMSDDEDMETADRTPNMNQPITANQLGAALAALTGAMSVPPGPSGGGGGGSGSGAPGTSTSTGGANALSAMGITNDFFRQAMEAAGTSSSQQPRQITENDLQQLREMGITDEGVARRALEASGGDIQAALELIFGDGL